MANEEYTPERTAAIIAAKGAAPMDTGREPKERFGPIVAEAPVPEPEAKEMLPKRRAQSERSAKVRRNR